MKEWIVVKVKIDVSTNIEEPPLRHVAGEFAPNAEIKVLSYICMKKKYHKMVFLNIWVAGSSALGTIL